MTAPAALAAALHRVAATLGDLTPAELEDLAAGRGQLVFRRAEQSGAPGRTAADPTPTDGPAPTDHPAAGRPTTDGPTTDQPAADQPTTDRPPAGNAAADRAAAVRPGRPAAVHAAVDAIRRLTSPDQVADHLQRERYTVPVLREIAAALGPTVSTAGRSKADLQRDIVEGTAGFRTRSAAMSGGAWS